MITPEHLKEVMEHKIREAGLTPSVCWEQSQVLDVGEGFFIELVLHDGEHLDKAQSIINDVQQLCPDTKIDSIVRALWTIASVEYQGPSRSADGGLRASSNYLVTLQAGARKTTVRVEVSNGATEILYQHLAIGENLETALVGIVRSFVQRQLLLGGTSYWDPLGYPDLSLSDAAILAHLTN